MDPLGDQPLDLSRDRIVIGLQVGIEVDDDGRLNGWLSEGLAA